MEVHGNFNRNPIAEVLTPKSNVSWVEQAPPRSKLGDPDYMTKLNAVTLNLQVKETNIACPSNL